MVIKYRFKLYPNIVCDDNKQLWQLEHFYNKRTYPKKKLIYNSKRKAFRIKSQWVSRKRLLKFMIPTYEVIEDVDSFKKQLKSILAC